MLQRMRELAVQSSNGTYSPTQRTYMQTEFDALSTQIGRIGTDTKWNDQATLATTATYTYQAGTSNGTTITVTLSGMSQGDLGLTGVNASIGASTTNAVSALTVIDSAIDKVNLNRAKIGAAINQMTYSADNMSNISTNLSASRSSIQDTDYAAASTQLSKAQIVQQAATAMLARDTTTVVPLAVPAW
jgi:flagellin